MRIISKLRDYYDSAMAFGQDQSVVFVRNAEELDMKKIPTNIRELIEPRISFGNRHGKDIDVEMSPTVVVFCGKTYKAITCVKHTKDPSNYLAPSKKEVKVLYSLEDVKDFLEANGLPFKTQPRYSWLNPKDTIAGFFEKQTNNLIEEFCIENRYVVLTCADMSKVIENNYDSQYRLIANGYLDKLQFFRVMDSFAAYQELDMFVSGTLPQSTAMPIEISDKDRILQHGFDKYSFRKPKEK